jgi:predicted DNA binding CopG/RHH family protein
MQKYTSEESALLDAIEAGEFKSVDNLKDELAKAKQAAKNTITKNKNINIRISESDIAKLKARSIEVGIPYQTIVSALIHNYTTGKIKLEA